MISPRQAATRKQKLLSKALKLLAIADKGVDVKHPVSWYISIVRANHEVMVEINKTYDLMEAQAND